MNYTLNEAWLDMARLVKKTGQHVLVRGRLTSELTQHTLKVDMRHPVLTLPTRKLSYRFMAAEAYWILTGDDQVATIAPYNSRIADFSDDGQRFFGAYGPKIFHQLPYVVKKLGEDPATRQAGLTIWRENPPATRDYPCTIAIWFQLRGGKLDLCVFMRSSDVWLGVPYDVFNFSMLAHLVCGLLREEHNHYSVVPGTLYITAASRHIYHDDLSSIETCLADQASLLTDPTPDWAFQSPTRLLEALHDLREKEGVNLRWWTPS